MGYMHIENLYKNIDIMSFKECYALEKIHGTSAHISWKDNKILYFSGGGKHDTFVKMFNNEELMKKFSEHFPNDTVILYGESYGGKQQGMSQTYGVEPRFILFDVQIGDIWLDVPNAEDVTKKMGLEFVDYVKIKTELELIDKERDKPSTQSKRNGIKEDKLREGVVLRPLIEVTKSNGKRVIIKHKRDEFKETTTKREVNPESLKILEDAEEITKEWVTPTRLQHVLDKLGNPDDITDTSKVIKAMIEDVRREGKKEIIESKPVISAIGREAARLFKLKISKIALS